MSGSSDDRLTALQATLVVIGPIVLLVVPVGVIRFELTRAEYATGKGAV